MSDDRSRSFPRDRHPTCRWGASLPQRIFLLLMLGVPLTVHGQETETPVESMQAMPAPHRMPGAHDLGSVPAVHGDAMGKSDNAEVTAGRPGSVSRSMPSGQGFAPNVTGPGLAPTIDEAQANRDFGAEKTLHDARAYTSNNHVSPKTPVDLDVTFSGPLCTVKRQTVEVAIHGYGTVEINEDTLHDAVVTQSGVVRSLYVFPGMEVKAGEPLVSIYSPERVNAQHMLLADFSKDEGNQISLQYFSSFSSSEKFLAQSRSNLKWWGFSDADIDGLLNTGQVREDYVFEADREEYVVETAKGPGSVVVAGDKSEENFVIPGEQIMRMASLESVWGMGFVNPEHDADFKLGDTIAVTVGEGAQARSFQGLIVHKHDSADPTTRKSDFHILLPNRDRALPPGGLVAFSKRVSLQGLWIPADALLYVGGRPSVIRKNSHGYEVVNVGVGADSGDLREIREGLKEGDQLVAAPRSELNPDTRVAGLTSWE